MFILDLPLAFLDFLDLFFLGFGRLLVDAEVEADEEDEDEEDDEEDDDDDGYFLEISFTIAANSVPRYL